jgi:hypothetical protein
MDKSLGIVTAQTVNVNEVRRVLHALLNELTMDRASPSRCVTWSVQRSVARARVALAY